MTLARDGREVERGLRTRTEPAGRSVTALATTEGRVHLWGMTLLATNYVSSQAPPAQAATSFNAVWSACSSSCL